MVIASPGSTATRSPGVSGTSRTLVLLMLPTSSISSRPPSLRCRRACSRDASGSVMTTSAFSARPIVRLPFLGSGMRGEQVRSHDHQLEHHRGALQPRVEKRGQRAHDLGHRSQGWRARIVPATRAASARPRASDKLSDGATSCRLDPRNLQREACARRRACDAGSRLAEPPAKRCVTTQIDNSPMALFTTLPRAMSGTRKSLLAVLLALTGAGCGDLADDWFCDDARCEWSDARVGTRRVAGQPAAAGPGPVERVLGRRPRPIALGHRLYFDTGFSGGATQKDAIGRDSPPARPLVPGPTSIGISCATCHDPARGGGDTTSVPGHVSVGAGWTDVNSLTTVNSAYRQVVFWNGRIDSLWALNVVVAESATTMNGNRLALAHRIFDIYCGGIRGGVRTARPRHRRRSDALSAVRQAQAAHGRRARRRLGGDDRATIAPPSTACSRTGARRSPPTNTS